MAYFGALATRIHVVAGIVLGLFFAALGLTGAGLAFRPALEERWYWPAASPGAKAAAAAWQAAAERVLASASGGGGGKLSEVRLRDGRAWEFVLRRRDGSAGESVYVDPANGGIVGRRAHADSPFDWMRRAHAGLLAGPFGTRIVSRLGLLLAMQGVLGLLVWGLKGFPSHAHALLGLSAGLVAAALGYTGWSVLTRAHAMVAPVVTLRGVENKVPLDRLVASALESRPGGKLAAIHFPSAPSEPFQFWFGERVSDGVAYADPYGALLPMPLANGDHAMRDWHCGPAGGWAARAIRVFAGAGLALLFLSGAWRLIERRRAS